MDPRSGIHLSEGSTEKSPDAEIQHCGYRSDRIATSSRVANDGRSRMSAILAQERSLIVLQVSLPCAFAKPRVCVSSMFDPDRFKPKDTHRGRFKPTDVISDKLVIDRMIER